MNKDAYKRYHYALMFDGTGAHWIIYDAVELDNLGGCREIFRVPAKEEDGLPIELKNEYERLIEWQEGDSTDASINIVEFIAERSEFNQKCKYGKLVHDYGVYCHNTKWLYAPTKCHRTWYTRGKEPDEDCEGYKPNEIFSMSTVKEQAQLLTKREIQILLRAPFPGINQPWTKDKKEKLAKLLKKQ